MGEHSSLQRRYLKATILKATILKATKIYSLSTFVSSCASSRCLKFLCGNDVKAHVPNPLYKEQLCYALYSCAELHTVPRTRSK